MSLYLSQFLTVFDEPTIKLIVINVITRLCNARDCLTGCNQFKPVFEQFSMIFEMRQPATGITPNLGNCNRKIDRTTVRFSSVLWIFSVHRTEPANTIYSALHMVLHDQNFEIPVCPCICQGDIRARSCACSNASVTQPSDTLCLLFGTVNKKTLMTFPFSCL